MPCKASRAVAEPGYGQQIEERFGHYDQGTVAPASAAPLVTPHQRCGTARRDRAFFLVAKALLKLLAIARFVPGAASQFTS